MKTTTINSSQALYDAQTPPDDSEYEKEKEAFLQAKEKYRKVIKSRDIFLMNTAFHFYEAIVLGNVDQELIDKYGDFMDDAIEYETEELAKEETGFKP